jgi:hypothetical protein
LGACAYLGTGTLLDVSLYYPANELQASPPVSLSMVEDGIRLQSPADLGAVSVGLEQLIGLEIGRICTFESDLTLSQAYVLFKLVDAARRRVFSGLAGPNNGDPGVIALDVVTSTSPEQMDDEIGQMQWMAPHFAASYGIQQLSAEDIQNQLQSLANQKLIKLQNSEIVLNEDLTDLVANFLTISGHLRLQAAHLDEGGKVHAAEVRGVRGQDNAWLLWTEDGKQAQFMGASPAQVIAVARDMLSGPEGNMPPTASVSGDQVPVGNKNAPNSADKKKKGGSKKGRWWKTILIVIVSLIALWAISFVIYSAMYY